MDPKQQVLDQLVEMSRNLGRPERDLVILGEGNTSAKVDADTFWVKASGTQLQGITAAGFVEVRSVPVLEMFQAEHLSDEAIKTQLMASRVDQTTDVRPSVETTFHALLLQLEGVRFIGHTHPTAVNAILCAGRSREIVQGRLFPDEIVCCGIAPVYVPYVDPGRPLARAIGQAVEDYLDEYGVSPRAILLENHGLIALGGTPQDVESVTLMWDKTARVLGGAYVFGGPRYLSEEHVNRIYTRPDEHYRQRLIRGRG
jgi:rhamnose utilization protein RhaD (predicted bifunctional aldolase and dehydrogenase)